MNVLHSTLSTLRDRWAPISHTSTFRNTGQITPDEFVLAGDYLVYKFPTWSWADASPPSKRVSYLPAGKQFLITRGVPCHRRLDENFAGDAGQDEAMVQDGFAAGEGGDAGGDDDGWLRTGGLAASQVARMKDVRTVDESGEVGEKEVDKDDEEEIPDMEDEEDDEEAIIRDPKGNGGIAYVGTSLLSLSLSLFFLLLKALAIHIQSAFLYPPNQSFFKYTPLKKKKQSIDPSEHTPSTSPTRLTIALRASTSPAISPRRNRSPRTS